MKKLLASVLILVLSIALLTGIAYADIGTEPKECVTFEDCFSPTLDESMSLDEFLVKLNAGEVELGNIVRYETSSLHAEAILENIDITFHHLRENELACCSIPYIVIETYSDIMPLWLHTDCTNILGHSWPSWGPWMQGHITHGSRCLTVGVFACSAFIHRWRECARTHCNKQQIDTSSVLIDCMRR